jgi:hypothetical protein
MIDIKSEGLITMPQAAAMLPGRPSLCALWRWRTRGVRGRKLESVVYGKTPYTSVEALERFARHLGGNEAPAIRSSAARERAIRKAEAELESAGV